MNKLYTKHKDLPARSPKLLLFSRTACHGHLAHFSGQRASETMLKRVGETLRNTGQNLLAFVRPWKNLQATSSLSDPVPHLSTPPQQRTACTFELATCLDFTLCWHAPACGWHKCARASHRTRVDLDRTLLQRPHTKLLLPMLAAYTSRNSFCLANGRRCSAGEKHIKTVRHRILVFCLLASIALVKRAEPQVQPRSPAPLCRSDEVFQRTRTS